MLQLLRCCTADDDLFYSICIALSKVPATRTTVCRGEVGPAQSRCKRRLASPLYTLAIPLRSIGTAACPSTGRDTELAKCQSRRRVPVSVVLALATGKVRRQPADAPLPDVSRCVVTCVGQACSIPHPLALLYEYDCFESPPALHSLPCGQVMAGDW
jgi:hypothetical protein